MFRLLRALIIITGAALLRAFIPVVILTIGAHLIGGHSLKESWYWVAYSVFSYSLYLESRR